MAQDGKPKILVALDESDHSFYALEWTLDHLITPFGSSPPFQILLIHGRPTPSSALGLAGPGSAEVIPIVEVDLKKTATKIMNRAKDLCISKGINEKELGIEVMEGDPRNVACEAVDKHHAAILVLGSHGYGAMKRAVLGSVSDYCAHHAQCTVMIVKKPKVKN